MKKIDIAALIAGIGSLILCIVFLVLFAVFGIRTFKTEGGFDQVKSFFTQAKHKVSEVTGDNFININDGNDKISVGPDGIFIEDGDDKVIISPSGIYVDDGDSSIVSIDSDGIKISGDEDDNKVISDAGNESDSDDSDTLADGGLKVIG